MHVMNQRHGMAVIGISVAIVMMTVPPVSATVVEQGELARIEVLGNDVDVDGDPLTVVALSTAAHGTTTYDGTVVTYQSEPGYLGEDSFSYTVMDPAGETGSATVLLTVQP